MPRTPALAVFVVVANAAGNYALNWGMKHGGILTVATLAGIGLLILWTLGRIRLLGQADLSYVLPVTSVGYLIPLILGAAFLGEPVSWQRWLGGAMIVAGAGLVAAAPAKAA